MQIEVFLPEKPKIKSNELSVLHTMLVAFSFDLFSLQIHQCLI